MKYKIEGYFGVKSGHPLVRVLVEDKKQNIQRNIYFSMDMLSSNTIISLKDLGSMNYLEDYDIGKNDVKKYLLKKPVLTFDSVIGENLKIEIEKIPVIAGNYTSNSYSVLGRNILDNFKLLFNKSEDEISMLYDDEPSDKLSHT